MRFPCVFILLWHMRGIGNLSEMMLIAATLEELLCIRVLRQIASVISHSLFPSSSHHYNPLCFVSFFQHNLFQPHPHLRFPHTKCLTSQCQKRPYFESWSAHTIWSRYAGLDMEEVRSLSPLLQTRSIVRTSPPFLRCVPELSTQEEFIHPAVCKLGCCPYALTLQKVKKLLSGMFSFFNKRYLHQFQNVKAHRLYIR